MAENQSTSAPQDAPAPVRWRATHLWLFLGTLCLYLVFWAGVDGYTDIAEYLDMAERLWLHGTLCMGHTADGAPVYHPYAVGLPFLSGPFVLLGAALEWLTGGAIPTRRVIALIVPVLGALSCVLLYDIGRRLDVPHASSFTAALLLGLGSPLLSFVQLYYAETASAFFVLLALWALLQSRARGGRSRTLFLALSGAGLAGVTACHHANVMISLGLWTVFVVAELREETRDRRARRRAVAAFTAMPLLVGAAILAVNSAHHGGPLHTGYAHRLRQKQPEAGGRHTPLQRHGRDGSQVTPHFWYHDRAEARPELFGFALTNVPRNTVSILYWLLRVPWIVAAFVFLPSLMRERRWVGIGVLAAGAAQLLLWSTYGFTRFIFFVARFMLPLTVLCGVPLLAVTARLRERFGARGLVYAGAAGLLWNVLFFLRGDLRWLQMTYCPGFGVTMQVPAWYMLQPARMFRTLGLRFFDIEPMWLSHWIVFWGLILAGATMLVVAARGPARARAEKA
jgi:hypothetical protein